MSRGSAATSGSGKWLAPWWKDLRPRWGHPWHSMCSYLAMFPPALPRYFIEQCSREGDLVLDPFSGRGTTPLEACLAGRIGVGSDLNPLAVLLTGAKVHPPDMDCLMDRLEELERGYRRSNVHGKAPPEIEMLFHDGVTLPQLLYFRSELSSRRVVDRYLLAALVGILHGNHPRDPRTARTLSISMPNTFSMSPSYIRKYIEKNGLEKFPFDVFELLRRRLKYLNRQGMPEVRGRVAKRDARDLSGFIAKQSVDLVVTSPPYLQVVRYGKFNWIRLWLLEQSVEAVDRSLRVEATDKRLGLSDQFRLPTYKKFIASCAASWEQLLRPGGVCVAVIGDVGGRGKESVNLAAEAWREIKEETGLQLVDIVEDVIHAPGKVTRIWGDRRGEATKVDRVLVMRKPGSRRPRTRNPAKVIEDMAAQG